jgi:NADPH:quinone reductase-like Zn-dependent oxidoreductase
MKAAVRDRFGSPDVIEIRNVEKPTPADDEVLVRVHAASLNIADWYGLTGTPYVGRAMGMGLFRPKEARLGTDYAGVVEAVGKDVTLFRPGDEVFGARTGAFAGYVCAKEDRGIVTKPPNVSFDEAAAVPVAGLTALQGLCDHGQLEAGQKVLLTGASGGVGTYAIQIAKAFGAEATAVVSPNNVELARSLGANRVIDYTREDFSRNGERYDLLLNVNGNAPWSACSRVLEPSATVVMVGAPRGTALLGPMGHMIRLKLGSLRASQKFAFFIAKINKADLETLRDLLANGKMTSVIDRHYALDEIADAFRYIGEGHARGKIIVNVA